MSKSKTTGIAPAQIIDTFGSDSLLLLPAGDQLRLRRLVLLEDLRDRYTAELSNGFGNLASRGCTMVVKYFDGVLPTPGPYSNTDLALQDLLSTTIADADAAMLRLGLQRSTAAVRGFVEAVNGYITEQQPWVLAKDDERRERLGTVLYVVAESLRGDLRAVPRSHAEGHEHPVAQPGGRGRGGSPGQAEGHRRHVGGAAARHFREQARTAVPETAGRGRLMTLPVAAPEPLPAPVIDSHCHLDIIADYSALEPEPALRAAQAAGVSGVIQVGVDIGPRTARSSTRTSSATSRPRSASTRTRRRRGRDRATSSRTWPRS